MTPPLLGIVIPTLDEARALPLLVGDLHTLRFPVRIVVADGGSSDGTPEIATRLGTELVTCDSSRAKQMNEGARALDAPWLLFLHADSRIPSETGRALERWLTDPPLCEAAHFDLRLDVDGLWWTLIERGQRIRERMIGLTYGDQGLLISTERFDKIGGFSDIPVMEDVAIIRALRRTGGVARIPAPIVTSARRYVEEGPIRAWLRNVWLISLYSLGVSPTSLSRWYAPRRATTVPIPPTIR